MIFASCSSGRPFSSFSFVVKHSPSRHRHDEPAAAERIGTCNVSESISLVASLLILALVFVVSQARLSLEALDAPLRNVESRQDHGDVQVRMYEEIARLREESSRAKDATIAKLQAQVQTLEEENASLKEQNASLKEENASLKEQNASLKQENASLKEQNASLKEQNASLKEQNASLLASSVQVQERNSWCWLAVSVLALLRLDVNGAALFGKLPDEQKSADVVVVVLIYVAFVGIALNFRMQDQAKASVPDAGKKLSP
jgi:cell division protein FtsB